MKKFNLEAQMTVDGTNVQVLNPTATIVTPEYPADLIDLSNWKLKVPLNTAQAGAPDEYRNPQLQTYTSDYFKLNTAKDGIVMKANAGGYTTSGSSYPRTQLGECDSNGTTLTWDNQVGLNEMKVRLAITHLAVAKKDINVAQVHDGSGYLIAVVLKNDGKLVVEANDNGAPLRLAVLEEAYQLGTEFRIELRAADGNVAVLYNGFQKAIFNKPGNANYFTTGAYVLTNVSKGDAAEAYGEVVLKELETHHN